MKLKKLESEMLGSASIKSSSWRRPLFAIAVAVSLASLPVWADEFPANCSKPNGGQGNTSTTGVNFANQTAHVGDTVQVFPSLGMAAGACQAENATGSVYIASGLLVTFLNNVTLPANLVYQCPTNTSPPCAPGPYNVLITPALVGAGVTSPGGSVAGVPKVVRALQWSFSSHVRTGDQLETLDKVDTASINIVTPCIQVQKFCNLPAGKTCFGPNDNISFRGFVTNCGDITLTNVTVVDSRTGILALFNPVTGTPLGTTITLPVGAIATFTNIYPPTQAEICAGNATNTVVARGTDTSDIGGPRASVTNSSTAICPICINPCIAVTKTCPGPVLVGQPQTISGLVTNCGDITLTNVVLNDDVLGPITNITVLPPGGSVSYSKTFTAGCAGNTNTVTATATSICGNPVQNSATAVCTVTSTPCISVTKLCNGPIVVGGIQTISGVVSNCGNITLTNIVVNDSILGPVTNIATLPVGGTLAYSKTFTAGCNPNTNTVTATATSICGAPVQASATAICAVTSNPCISVTKLCNGPIVVGGIQTISGVVSNCGNITLTNIVVNDDILGPVTNIATLPVGGTLAYSKTFTAGCNPNTNTVTATATSICGAPVQASATAPCLVTSSPCISVTKLCNGPIVVGGIQTISGVVSNCGNITLTNIVVNDDILGPVTNIATLPVGGTLAYSKTFTATCAGNTNTVTATATSICGQPVQASATAPCLVSSTACIAVTKLCNGPIVVGGIQTISGVVSNCGNITLTNIVVNDDILGPVTNIATLPVGGTLAYSKTFTAGCNPNTNTVTATARSTCGTLVQASATAICPVTSTPCISVTKLCNGPIVVGGIQTISGVVSNCGNITLTNIVVNDDILGPVTNIATLPVGGTLAYSKTFTATCAGNTNTVTATATSICGTPVQASATAPCLTTHAPCLAVTKICTPTVVEGGAPVTFSGIVTNCGNITLSNVVVRDSLLGNAIVLVVPLLPPGASQPYTTNFVTSSDPADCGKRYTNTVTATATDICLDHQLTNIASCTFTLDCPKICVTKEIACFIGTNGAGADLCDTFSKLATGVQGDTQNPAFCYRISVTNCGSVALTNVTVIDDKYGDLSAHFNCISPVLDPGEGCTFIFKAELDGASLPNHISVVTNTVVARGQSANTGRTVTTNDFAVARIIPAGIACEQLYTIDNGVLTNCVKLDVTDAPHTVVTYVRLINTGLADLLNIHVINDIPNPCDVDTIVTNLPSGSSVLVALCVNTNYTCSNAVSTITVTASEYALTNVAKLCAHDIDGKVIVVRSECPGCVECTAPNACRVTGGGRQDDPLVYPPDVRYVTHGGQVGAPVGNRICEVTTNFFLGNPCIHGRWTHVRHDKGGLQGNFHARFYDTLECACLDTNVTAMVTNIPGVDGAANQTYVNLIYGQGTKINGLCNPDDHKVAGPQPRPAPANKIVFTGVGDWADPNGRRTSRATLFRVDIEDRSEPGGSHPRGGVFPPDRYRIRIWVLSDIELAELNGGGPDRYLINFRNAISACNGIDVQDGASVPNGTAAFGVRAPDIDDGGELERGNHQIHPAIKNCDPFNPTGPGLAKP